MHINVSMIQGIWINLSSKLGFNATHVVYIFATYILPGSLHSQWWNHTTWYGWNDHCTPVRHVSFFITMYQMEAPPPTSYGGLCSISHKCWFSCFMFIGLYHFSQILKVISQSVGFWWYLLSNYLDGLQDSLGYFRQCPFGESHMKILVAKDISKWYVTVNTVPGALQC